MAYPKDATPEERRAIDRKYYLKYRDRILLHKRQKYAESTPEQKKARLEYKNEWHRRRIATDEAYAEHRRQLCRKNQLGKSKRAYCHKCENWKWIDPPVGSLYGGFHYCKVYGNVKFHERKKLCAKLERLVLIKKLEKLS